MKVIDTRIKKKYRFSVFTATYNRSSLLHNVYEDLKSQTFKDFEWVIVNDGSSDETDSVVYGFIKENIIPILYISKKNGGKHSAWKAATSFFLGEYEVGADDDDNVTPDMLEVFDKEWCKLEKENDYESFWEIRARVEDSKGKLVGPVFEKNFDSDYNEFCYKLGYGYIEFDGCRKISVLKKEAAVPDNILFGDRISNYSEGLRWSNAARYYKTRYINKVVRIYRDTPNSLCKQKSSTRKYYTNLVNSIYSINEQRDLMLSYSKKQYIFNLINIAYQCVRLKRIVLSPIISKMDKLGVCLMFPLAFCLSLVRK